MSEEKKVDPNPEEKKPEAAAAKPAPAQGAPAPVGAGATAAPSGAAAAVPAKPAAPPKPKVVIPDPVFNPKAGNLLHGTRYWPTERWASPWSLPSYRNGALMLAGIILGLLGTGAVIGELAKWGDKLYSWLHLFAAAHGAPPVSAEATWVVVKILIVLHVVLINGLWAIWWERKISAHIQSRVGPMYAGGFHGWLQTPFDGLKLILKEDITPAAADKWIHMLAPCLVIAPCIFAFAPVSFGRELAAADLDMGVLYIFAVSGISVIGLVMAGWSSGNKYSLLGGLRSAAQIVSYELPRGFSVVPIIMLAGSLNIGVIAEAQSGYMWGFFPKWYIFYPVVGQLAFVIFLIASIAETNRTPFDLPEAESELVSGFATEYSAMKWSIFFLAEYGYVLLASFLLAAFFLGGGAAPIPQLSIVPSWIWMLGKAMFMMFVFLWVRWTFPRFRADQMMDLCWKVLLPWTFVNIAVAGVYLAL